MNPHHKQRLTITLNQDVLDLLDRYIDGERLRNRSHAIEYFLSRQLKSSASTAVILASGDGSKMRPFTYETPKSLLPIQGKPLLEHMLVRLREANISDIILVVHSLSDKIREYFGNGSSLGVSIRYVEEQSPEGTATSLAAARSLIEPDSSFLLLYGDVLADLDIADLTLLHDEHDALATLALTTTDNPSEYGVVKLKGQRIVGFSEKPDSKKQSSALINAGLMIVHSDIFDLLEAGDYKMLERDAFHALVASGRLCGYPFEGQWFDVGTVEAYEKAMKQWGK